MEQIWLGARLILYLLRKLWRICHFIIISFLHCADFYFSILSTRLNIVNHSFIDKKGGITINLENAIHKRPTSLMKEKSSLPSQINPLLWGGSAFRPRGDSTCLSHKALASSSTLGMQLLSKIGMKVIVKELLA
jgi:hypothetical protein